ncbi:MAG: hypothetical protein KIT44_06460 [Opitutaceae bacterium]|nr:hypothetical protein [Opitutaceae bacterium]
MVLPRVTRHFVSAYHLLSLRRVWSGCALLFVLPAVPAAPLNGLVENSPFSPGKPDGVQSAAAPLEFRGTFVDGGERFFSVHDMGSRTSAWAMIGEGGLPFVIRSYEPETHILVVERQGVLHRLPLRRPSPAQASPGAAESVARLPKGAPVAPGGPPAPGRALQTMPASDPNSGPGVALNSPAEAAKLAEIAAEIRRRRELRAKAAAIAPPEANQP